jgi:hypothetical protein
LTLSVSAAAFAKPSYSILAKINEERTSELQEVESEEESESEPKFKLGSDFDGPDLGTPELIARELNRRTSTVLVIVRKQCPLSISHESLYLLYHSLKLDCP